MIKFPGNGPWLALNQVEVGRIAGDNVTAPLWLRVWLLALADANRIGHAEYGPGSLQARLGARVDAKTGAVIAIGASAVSNAIRTCKEYGLLTPDSGARCLVLSQHVAQKEGKGRGVVGTTTSGLRPLMPCMGRVFHPVMMILHSRVKTCRP